MKIKILCISILIAFISCSAGKTVQKEVKRRPGYLLVKWEFKKKTVNSEPWTEAWIVIKGKTVQREYAGEFFGTVMRIMESREDVALDMVRGIISGFMTNHAGSGSEVMARYDDRHHKLVIVSRKSSDGRATGNYRALKSFRIRERGVVNSQ